MLPDILKFLNKEKPILITGTTASGKSRLAISIAEKFGGSIVNADSIQVYNCWNILSARPPQKHLKSVPHFLYGHLDFTKHYSTGHWLREVKTLLKEPSRLIIVGGTGMYFNALLKGLADIPEISKKTKQKANKLTLNELIGSIDNDTLTGLDRNNRARVQRAWEVLEETGKSLKSWQKLTPSPLIKLNDVNAIVVNVPQKELEKRISTRFDQMLKTGAIEEVRAMMGTWDSSKAYTKAIGAREILSYLNNEIDLKTAREKSIIATRQYAKRQKTWFKKNMLNWQLYEE